MKSMKKSMFVTTILMVVLLIVALSTATFAWYTANSSVTVNKTSVVSATSNSASLVIDEAVVINNLATQSSVDLTMAPSIMPMIYDASAAPTVGTTTYTDFIGDFVTFTIDNSGKYASAPEAATPATISAVKGHSNEAQTQTSFFLTNLGGSAANISATVTIANDYAISASKAVGDDGTGWCTDEACTTPAAVDGSGKLTSAGTYYKLKSNDLLRVAMFIGEKYVGTWAMTGKNTVKYADYTGAESTDKEVGDSLLATSNYTATVSGTQIANVATNVASMAAVEVKIVAWFDGDALDNSLAGTGANFSVSFAGSKYSA